MKVLFLESFYGGSHQDFANGFCRHTSHDVTLVTLPARFWKWRMRGAALYFLKQVKDLASYDVILATGLMGVADFKALAGPGCPPICVYFHETQLTYPLAPGEHMDFQFGFTDITTALAAERVVFNSRTHMDAFFTELPRFLGRMPEFRPQWVAEEIRPKASFLHPGCQFPADLTLPELPEEEPPLIIWNHRWEFDKNPGAFFSALQTVLGRGADFRLAVLGENFQAKPKEFIQAQKRFSSRIVQWGYADSKEEYASWLKQGAVAVSTAVQENFGISVVEAMRWGCLPLLPLRLSYPEILPKAFHRNFLYNGQADLEEKLFSLLVRPDPHPNARRELSLAMAAHAWELRGKEYDALLSAMAGSS